MKFFRDLSIRHKLMILIMTTSTIVLVLSTIFFFVQDVLSIRQSMVQDLQFKADVIAANSTAALSFYDRTSAQENLEALRDDPNIVYGAVLAKDGSVFAEYAQPGNNPKSLPHLPISDKAQFADQHLDLSKTIILDGEQIGAVFIRSNMDQMYSRLKGHMKSTVIVVAILLLIALGLSSVLQRTISTSILNLVDTMDIVSREKDYTIRAEKPSNDELGLLVDDFNSMLYQIQQRDEALQRGQDKLEDRVRERTAELKKEITERKRGEAKVKASLMEKEVLLKEIHHRVKNNLQVICSLLNIQSSYIQDSDTRELFDESQDRVRTMALIHENLYKSKDLTRIDFSEYIRNLSAQLFRSHSISSGNVKLDFGLCPVVLDIETALPCGLILNELITNSLKYAFPDGADGKIEIKFQKAADNGYALVVGDNGRGFPEGVDFMKSPSLGLKLVNTLVKQLKGTIVMNATAGTEFKIEFSHLNYKNRMTVDG